MKQNLTVVEMQALLRMAQMMPAATSPLAGVQPAQDADRPVLESLGAKGAWNGSGTLTPEWQRALATLTDPAVQATAHIEGIGTARYFGGAGGIASMVAADANQQRVISGLTIDTILNEIHDLLPWRGIPDGPPLRADVSTEELTAVAAIADVYREEQLRACIERRAPSTGRVTRDDAARQISLGVARPDARWLISILARFSPFGAPGPEALDAGAAGLIARNWGRTSGAGLLVGSELEVLCAGFGNVHPFLALSVGPPWSDPEVALLLRGPQHFWSVEFYGDSGRRRATISRLGARAMDAMLRQRLAKLGPVIPDRVEPPAPKPAAVAPPPSPEPPKIEPRPVQAPAPKPQPPTCVKCGTVLTKPFCTKCGTPARPPMGG